MHPTKSLSLREADEVMNSIRQPISWSDDRVRQEAVALINYMRTGGRWFKSFAIERGYAPCHLTMLAERVTDMAEALEYARDAQEATLLAEGLDKRVDSNLVKLILSNRHGWQERQQVEHVGLPPMQVIHYGDPATATPYHNETIDVTPQAISTAASPTPQSIVDVATNPLAV